jgi:adenylate cyclase
MSPDATQLRQFLSEDVAREAEAAIAAGEAPLAARRRDVSILACDLSGFRPLADAHPDRALEVLNSILAPIAAAIFAERGTLMSFPGDGALAVFGAPFEDPAHRDRADRVATAISGAIIDQARAQLEADGLPPLGIDVAVESGPALCGVIGAEPRWEYAAIGGVTARAIDRLASV